MIVHDTQEPATYPAGDAALWSRIFHYVRYRWPERQVVWTVEGIGKFIAPLKPATITQVEYWDGQAWQVDTMQTLPTGVMLAGDGHHRVTATVGDATVPADAQEAYDRLSQYMTDLDAAPGATSVSDGDYSVTRSANAAAKALQYSGAADLLRPYR